LDVAAILGAAGPALSSRRGWYRHARTRVGIVAFALIVAAALALVLALNPTSGARAGLPTAGPGSASPALARLAASSPGRSVEVIIQLRRGVNTARGRALVRALGGRPGVDLGIINGLSARLTAGQAERLALSPLVRAVSLNAAIRDTALTDATPWTLATPFDQTVGATRLWNRTTGAGVGVAVIDTGISGDLPDFQTSQGSGTSRVIASAVTDPNATSANDTYGHGTAVAGLVAGNGWYRDSSDSRFGQYAGTAPDANLISIKVADDSGHATTLDAIYGLQFAVDHKADYNIRVINLSFRSTDAQSYTSDPLDAAVEQAWFAGITVVAAAGNMGDASDAVSYAPGNDPYVITVGAVDAQGTASPWDDVEASWSSRGQTQDGFSKPDVLAPGAHIVSTLAPDSAFAGACPTCIVADAYFQVSGTSLAAPMVSGLAADLIAAHPRWTPSKVKGALVNSAISLPSGGSEVHAMDAYWASGSELVSDQGLTPNDLIDPNTSTIDYDAASWSAASWSTAADPLAASWSAASWSCVDCSSTDAGDVNPTAASWSDVGWATTWG
jgi:serine protease AprX